MTDWQEHSRAAAKRSYAFVLFLFLIWASMFIELIILQLSMGFIIRFYDN